MLGQLVGLREIPDCALRLIVVATTQDAGPRMLIHEFFGPLPHVAHHIHHSEWTCARRMRIHRVGESGHPRLVCHRNGRCIPFISPRISTFIGPLRRILPFPLMRETFA